MEEQVQKATDQATYPETNSTPFFKKRGVMLLIGAVLIIILGLITILIFNKPSNKLQNSANEDKNELMPQASIYFEPGTNLGAGVGVRQNVKVFIDTQGREVDRAVMVFQYDPKVLTNVVAEQVKDPKSAISNSFQKADIVNDAKNGLVSFTLNTASGTPAQKGSGQVALLSFTRKTQNPTSISLASNSSFSIDSEVIKADLKSLFLQRVTSNN